MKPSRLLRDSGNVLKRIGSMFGGTAEASAAAAAAAAPARGPTPAPPPPPSQEPNQSDSELGDDEDYSAYADYRIGQARDDQYTKPEVGGDSASLFSQTSISPSAISHKTNIVRDEELFELANSLEKRMNCESWVGPIVEDDESKPVEDFPFKYKSLWGFQHKPRVPWNGGLRSRVQVMRGMKIVGETPDPLFPLSTGTTKGAYRRKGTKDVHLYDQSRGLGTDGDLIGSTVFSPESKSKVELSKSSNINKSDVNYLNFVADAPGGFGTWSPDQAIIQQFEVDMLRTMFRSFARLQEGENFVPGLIDTKEVLYQEDFENLLWALGASPTRELIDEAFSRADTARKGWISYRRFLKAHLWIMSQGHDGFDYDALFDMLDANNDGDLSLDEITGLTTATGKVITREMASEYWSEMGKPVDSTFTREEFVEMLRRRKDLAWVLRTGYRAIFVMGPPACGKGTYCAEIIKALDVNHVSTGELLREEVTLGTPLGRKVDQNMKRGKLVDSKIMIVLLQKYLRKNPGKHVFVDGFPRAIQNSVDFFQLCGKPDFALMFDCPDEEVWRRLKERAKKSGRADDQNDDTIRQRLKIFHKDNSMVLQHLRDNDVKVFRIDATQPIDYNLKKILSIPQLMRGGDKNKKK